MNSKFLGETKGNRNLKTNRSAGGGGGGESHSKGVGGKFVGKTKGNKVMPSYRNGGMAKKGC